MSVTYLHVALQWQSSCQPTGLQTFFTTCFMMARAPCSPTHAPLSKKLLEAPSLKHATGCFMRQLNRACLFASQQNKALCRLHVGTMHWPGRPLYTLPYQVFERGKQVTLVLTLRHMHCMVCEYEEPIHARDTRHHNQDLFSPVAEAPHMACYNALTPER